MKYNELQQEIEQLTADEFARDSQLVDLIEKLNERVDELEKRVAQLEAEPAE